MNFKSSSGEQNEKLNASEYSRYIHYKFLLIIENLFMQKSA